MGFDAVLFDWDGTLVNSMERKIHNCGLLFSETFGVPATGIEASYRMYSGIPRRNLFDAICTDNAITIPDANLYEELSRRFTELNTRNAKPEMVFPDVVDTLKKLRAHGVWLGVSSSAAIDEVKTVAENVGLSTMLDEMLGSSGDFKKGEPHVSWLERRFGFDRSRILFVGDEPADIRIAREAGMKSAARVSTHTADHLRKYSPDFVLVSLTQLPDVVFG